MTLPAGHILALDLSPATHRPAMAAGVNMTGIEYVVRLPWSDEDFCRAKALYDDGVSMKAIAATMGLPSEKAARNRLYRRGALSRDRFWTEEETQRLVDLYTRAGRDGVLGLEGLAKEMGRDAGNLSRKAKNLGLPTNINRRVVEVRKDRRKFKTEAELRQHRSETSKRWIRENGHPRGALGMKHTPEAIAVIGRKSAESWARKTEKQRLAHTEKSVLTRIANGTYVTQIARGTWKAGWREIGGKRNFYRSRWEANYARYLEWLKSLGQIKDWAHEPEVFWFEAIKRGVRSYKPDFRVWENDGSSALHEVKGWMDDRSRTCLRRMAKYYPAEKLIVIDGRQYRAIRLKVMSLIPDWEDSARDNHE